jgi:hypothetical protein
MPQTLIGLFKSASSAEEAVRELEAGGLARRGASLISGRGGAGYADSPESEPSALIATGPLAARFQPLASAPALARTFAGIGVPEEDSRLFAEGLRRGATVVVLPVDEPRAEQAAEILDRHGAENLDEHAHQWFGGAASVPEPRGRVRLRNEVLEEPVERNVVLRERRVHVERRTVDRLATEGDLRAFQPMEIELVETVEESFVVKTARVVEEVVATTSVQERQETVRDRVRQTRVDVSRIT